MNAKVDVIAEEINIIENSQLRVFNDKIRNAAYKKAVDEKVVPFRATILNIGAGTGLVALFCIKRRPITVAAVETSAMMCTICQMVFHVNHTVEDLLLVDRPLKECKYIHVGGKRHLMIFEDFDATLIGEDLLPMIVHVNKLLMAKNAVIMPARAQIFAVGLESKYLSMKYRLDEECLKILKYPGRHVHLFTGKYNDVVDMPFIKDFRVLTDETSIMKFNFNDLEDVENKIVQCGDDIQVKVIDDGHIDVVITWFNLSLTDSIQVTTNPNDKNKSNAWPQAVFFNFKTMNVASGETIDLKFDCQGGKLKLVHEVFDEMEFISQDVLKFLNDLDLIKMIKKSIPAMAINLSQITEISSLELLDICPFPFFGMLMMKRGARSLKCFAKTDRDKQFIERVFLANGIDLSKITLVQEAQFTINHVKNDKFHAVYTHFLKINGDLDMKMLAVHDYMKNVLHPDGLIFPYKTSIEAKLIQSNWLELINYIDDANVNNYKVADCVHEYLPWKNTHIDISTLEHETMSNAVNIADLGRGVSPEEFKVDIVKTGNVTAILTWFIFQIVKNGEVIATDRTNSAVDSVAFLVDPKKKIVVKEGDNATLKVAIAPDGSFKLYIEL